MKEALIVLDAQNIYTNEESELYCEDASQTIKNINSLINESTKRNLPVIIVQHIHKTDGTDIGKLFEFDGEAEDNFNFKEGTDEVELDNELVKPSDATYIKKTRYSAFKGTNLLEILKDQNVEKIVVCGFMTNFCCESTAREALDLDYYVDFIIDATGTPGTDEFGQMETKNAVAELLAAGFARVLNTSNKISNW